MHVRTAAVLPLKPEPVVRGVKNSNVESLHKLLYAVAEEPVIDGWIVDDGYSAARAGVGIIG